MPVQNMATEKKTVAVLGATGNQGGSVARALLADGSFHVRVLSRNPTASAFILTLVNQGAQAVAVDLDRPETLDVAFAGCDAIFAVTVPGENELKQGKAIVDVALKCGVKFMVWSTAPWAEKVSNGKYIVPAYDDKAKVQEYIKEVGLPATFLFLGTFLENFFEYNWLQVVRDDAGTASLQSKYPLYLATSPINTIWVKNDVGAAVLGILKHYDSDPRLNHREICCSLTRSTLSEVVAAIQEVTGLATQHIRIPEETFSKLAPPEVFNMLKFRAEYGGAIGLTVPDPLLKEYGVRLSTIKDWVDQEVMPWLKKQNL